MDAVVSAIEQAWNGLNNIAGVAILLGILVTQVVKSYDDVFLKSRDMNNRDIFAAGAVLTMILFALCLWFARAFHRDITTVFNLLAAGVGAPIIEWALRKYVGFDLEKVINRTDKGESGS